MVNGCKFKVYFIKTSNFLFAFNFCLNLHTEVSIDKITYQPQINYFTIAIASILKDYRLSFFINQELHLNLEKSEDLFADDKKKEDAKKFSKYYFFDELSEFEYYLVQNKAPGALYIKGLKNFDYLFIVKTTDEDIIDLTSLNDKIKDIPEVQMSLVLDALKPAELKLIEKDF